MKAAKLRRKPLFLFALLIPFLVAAAEAIDAEILKDLEFFSNIELLEFSVFATEFEKADTSVKEAAKEARHEKR
ncbi:MAG: hypothetical protein A2X94_17030 [Bdellovibrionales bacterium GWB1_55_8]|nr:MAG: hypothetical protein A2X94_17030 [Bdellovibrionales bacterium GWB1_55_8]